MINKDKRMWQLTKGWLGGGRIRKRRVGDEIIEETRCPRQHTIMLNPAGHEVACTTSPGRIATRESRRYKSQHMENLIIDGFLPRDECPLTMRYADVVDGPLVEKRKGDKVCEGAIPEGGCKHYERAKSNRREANLAKQEQIAKRFTPKSEAAMEALSEALSSGRVTMHQAAAAAMSGKPVGGEKPAVRPSGGLSEMAAEGGE